MNSKIMVFNFSFRKNETLLKITLKLIHKIGSCDPLPLPHYNNTKQCACLLISISHQVHIIEFLSVRVRQKGTILIN